MKCTQCDSIGINGVLCHEQGCPEAHIDLSTGRPYLKECRECGCNFEPEDKHQSVCDEVCAEVYFG